MPGALSSTIRRGRRIDAPGLRSASQVNQRLVKRLWAQPRNPPASCQGCGASFRMMAVGCGVWSLNSTSGFWALLRVSSQWRLDGGGVLFGSHILMPGAGGRPGGVTGALAGGVIEQVQRHRGLRYLQMLSLLPGEATSRAVVRHLAVDVIGGYIGLGGEGDRPGSRGLARRHSRRHFREAMAVNIRQSMSINSVTMLANLAMSYPLRGLGVNW